MKVVDDIRRDNLRIIELTLGGPAKTADAMGMSLVQYLNLRNGAKDSKTGKPRGMRQSTARRIEEGANKPKGWLDVSHDAPPRPGERRIAFDVLDVRAAAGPGITPSEYPENVQRLTVLESWALSHLGIRDLARIKIITAQGTSMQGTIENDDLLFVDASVHAFDGDGIYIIGRDGGVQVKRLQKLHGNVLAIISDNTRFKTEELKEDDANAVIVHGRVLAVWSLRRFW